MTTTTRICLDMLTLARARHEEYVGPWLPEPIFDTAALTPDSRTELAEDLSMALLLTLDWLSPLERAAFLLHDVFDFSFSEVAAALERTEAACRQLAARARASVRAARPRGVTAPPALSGEIDAQHAQLLSAFMAATGSGDLKAPTQLLASDVRVVTDGGGKVRAALNAIDGADRVARFLVDVTRKRPDAWWRDGLHGALCDRQRSTRCHRGRTRETGANRCVRDRGRRDSGALRGTQSGQVTAFGGGGDAARARSRIGGHPRELGPLREPARFQHADLGARVMPSSVLDDVRSDFARPLLQDRSLSIGDIAFFLQYSEPAAFHRSFRRWTGQTPRAFREA